MLLEGVCVCACVCVRACVYVYMYVLLCCLRIIYYAMVLFYSFLNCIHADLHNM